MPPLIFRVIAWGPLVGQGAFGAQIATLGGIVKPPAGPDDATVANEYICNRLALLLGLPAPPGGLTRLVNGDVAFLSLRFGDLQQAPPPIVPQTVIQDNPLFAAGIVAFDTWIGNGDRHTTNVAYLPQAVPLAIFDHGLALAGVSRQGIPAMPNTVNQQTPPGCLLPELHTAKDLSGWVATIKTIPVGILRAICDELVSINRLTQQEAMTIADWLDQRRQYLIDILKTERPDLQDWGMV